MTEVVAALIIKNGAFMINRRPEYKARGNMYEFVGGKVEKGEDPKAALVRECREEMNVTVSVGDIFTDVVHKYPDLTVHLTVYYAEIISGTPELIEHTDIRYITPREIDGYEFCPADVEILEKIRQTMGN